MTDIVTLTVNPSLDISTEVDRVVADEKLRADRPLREPGGGGVNVARAITQLGGEAHAVYTCGGAAGDALERMIGDELPNTAIGIADATRENISIVETSTEQQFRFVMPGPDITRDEWESCLAAVDDLRPGWLVASGSLAPGLPDDAYAELAERCAQRGVPVVLDTSGEPLARALEAGVHLIKPNLGELERLVGAELETDSEIRGAVDDLLERGAAEVVVVSLGAGGAYAAGIDMPGQQVRSPTVPIRSKVGAGDSMVAGLVLGLARGDALPDAVRRGVAAGAAAVMTEGSALCRREDAERLYEQLRGGS